mmetsp:Transcript_51407/g.107409  ORF Transcript_51407/g.107409 Transcript_51407/m.107409 type:complete len:94 (-) Transcript_51407:512-793(-)
MRTCLSLRRADEEEQGLNSSILAVEAKHDGHAQGEDGCRGLLSQHSLVEVAVAASEPAAAPEDGETAGTVLPLVATAPKLAGRHALGQSLLQQ